MQIWQYLIPQHGLSRLIGFLANRRCSRLKNLGIKLYIRFYGVDMSAAQQPDYTKYETFNDFFIRQLKSELRPIVDAEGAIACPADGCISEIGSIEKDQLLQAKGHYYSLSDLLGDAELAQQFVNGNFATVYLSPKDYHRFHIPYSGRLKQMIHIPGKLFSVNTKSVAHISGLFARNERVIALFETDMGPMAFIAVGAVNVGSITMNWHGLVTPPTAKIISRFDYSGQDISFNRGDEMGYFQLGSTVIVLFPENKMTWDAALEAGTVVNMGQLLGEKK